MEMHTHRIPCQHTHAPYFVVPIDIDVVVVVLVAVDLVLYDEKCQSRMENANLFIRRFMIVIRLWEICTHTHSHAQPGRQINHPPPPSPQFQDSAHPLTQFINLNIHRRCLSHRHCILHISNEDMYLARSVSSTCITELNDFYYLLRCLARSREQARFSSPSPERYGTWCI